MGALSGELGGREVSRELTKVAQQRRASTEVMFQTSCVPDGNFTVKADVRGSRRREERVEEQVRRVKGEQISFELGKIKPLMLDWPVLCDLQVRLCGNL